jgi:hypothetical protein
MLLTINPRRRALIGALLISLGIWLIGTTAGEPCMTTPDPRTALDYALLSLLLASTLSLMWFAIARRVAGWVRCGLLCLALTILAAILMFALLFAHLTALDLLDARFDLVARAGWLFTTHCAYPFPAEFKAPFGDIIYALYPLFSFYVCMRIGQRVLWREPRPMTE